MARKAPRKVNVSKSASMGGSSDLQRLESMLKLMERYGLGELELEDEGSRVFLRKMGAGVSHGMPSAVAQHANAVVTAAQAHIPAPAPVVEAAAAKKAGAVTATAPENQKKVLSPFVGTFYRAANPTAEPYAKEGQSVRKGQTLCIIEAMKLMNEIESDFNGKVISCLVENGQPVEFGEPLFIIET